MVYINSNRNIGIRILDGRKYIHVVRRDADHLWIDEIAIKDFDSIWEPLPVNLKSTIRCFLNPNKVSGLPMELNNAYKALQQFNKGVK
jgi:hypothetical protein